MSFYCYRNKVSWLILFFCFNILLLPATSVKAQNQVITDFTAFYRHGQVFLTWKNVPDPFTYYKVYRSAVPVTSGDQLPDCEYLGWTNAQSSKDYDLTRHDNQDRYLVIDSGSLPLNSATGLFVATTLADGNYYYAVTTLSNGVEETTIDLGINTLKDPIAETVEAPQPVFQQSRFLGDKEVEIYATFTSSKFAVGQPLMNAAGFFSNDFALYRNGATGGEHPIRIRFHGGGADFFYNIINVDEDEINLNPEDFLPGGDNASWWGANQNFDIYNNANNQMPPASGTNYNFCQQRITLLINWAIKNLPVDSNRIYLEGSSLGSIGAYFYTMLFPEKIAAVKLSGSVFNLSFENDLNPACTLNAGKSNRVSGDEKFGMVNTNLPSNLGYPFYNLVNGPWVMRHFDEQDYPVIYSVNGKNDTVVGWTEKTIYYDSLNTLHCGGYYFWDGRKHGGGQGLVWGDENFDLLKYRNHQSFPAFANCSTNENPGNGTATDGAPFGTVNGFLDWNTNITDDTAYWSAIVFMKDLKKQDNSLYPAPDHCTVDVTLRRRQLFHPAVGDTIVWNTLHHNIIIQSGKFVYAGGVVTIPQVVVYKDSIQLEVSTDKEQISSNTQDIFFTAYPNPFSQYTAMHFELGNRENCSLKVYDLQGRLVRTLINGLLDAGTHEVVWDADNGKGAPVSNGIYLAQIQTGAKSATLKIYVVR